jgi:hypothetical protein
LAHGVEIIRIMNEEKYSALNEKLKISAVMNLKTSKGDERRINNMN